ncbi:MAG TPA: DUF2339 domain-containing protein [Blastocatellia bacterium]|nr:DUF2339 domain-containing protein [Blastocatellia bacterium]
MTDEEPSPDRIAELIKRINQMDEMLRQQAWRIYHLEQRLGGAPARPAPLPPERPAPHAAEPPRVTQPPVTPPPVIQPPKPEARQPAAAPPQTAAHETRDTAGDRPQPTTTTGARLPAQPPLPSFASSTVAPPRAKSRSDLEALIGGNWFQRIGVIAVTLGVAFFLKYAYDNEWIGKGVVLWACITFGVVILITGERLRPRYHNYAYGLTGLGILVLYTCFYAAYGLLHLWQPVPAFVGMVLVTATASLLAARYNALPIAVLGLIGGFLTPIVLSTGHDNEVGLFSYIALLDLGVLALAYSKQWRALNYMAFGATVFMFIAWYNTWYAVEKLWPTVGFLTLFFAIFALLAVLYNVVNRRPTRWLDLAMVFANALLYFATSYGLLEDQYQARLGLFAALVSAFYLGLGYFTYRRDREDRLLLYTFWGLAILFAVLAVPIQFHQQWITMGWAIEGAILTWIGLRVNDRISRYGALIVFLIAVTHWLMADLFDFAYHADAQFVPLWNQRGLSCAVLIAMLAAAASFYKRFGAQIETSERQMFASLYTLGANALAVTWLTLDANDYFGQAQAQAYEQAGKPVGFGASAEWKSLDNERHLILSALWSVYAAVALVVGTRRNLKALRVAALLLLVLTAMKLLFRDLLYYDAAWHKTIFNPTFAAFAAFVAACAVGAWFYGKSKALDDEERSLALVVLVGAANLFAVIALSAEVLGHFERLKADPSHPPVDNLENMKLFAVSAVWIIYGAISSLIGIRRGRWGLRMASLGLLGLAAVKLLVMDLRYYDAAWHTMLFNPTFAAFALLIAVLVVVAWYYHRAAAIDEAERQRMVPVIIGAANLLALISLSAEIIGHFMRRKAPLSGAQMVGDAAAHLDNDMLMWLSVLWVVYAAAALVIGIRRDSKWLRVGARGLLALAAVKALAYDLSYYASPWHSFIVNQTFAVFALLVAALAVGVWFYSHATEIDEQEREAMIPTFIVAANLLAVLALSAEGYGHYAMQIAGAPRGADLSDLLLAQKLSLTVVWTVYGGLLLTVGLVRRRPLLRLMALLLLGLTILKVYLLDIWSLKTLYRVIALILLGAVLLLVSFLYQPLRRRLAEADDDEAQAETD